MCSGLPSNIIQVRKKIYAIKCVIFATDTGIISKGVCAFNYYEFTIMTSHSMAFLLYLLILDKPAKNSHE